MAVHASLVATIASPLDRAVAEYPVVFPWPGRRLLLHRGDTEVVTCDIRTLDGEALPEVRFPAPWPRPYGMVSVSPRRNAVVFAGAHAVRAVGAAGVTLWEKRHACWAERCAETHGSWHEHANDAAHVRVRRGPAAFNVDGSQVWAHVPGPAAGQELWIVLDAVTGRVLGQAETRTLSSGSDHLAYPDPARMGLSPAEGDGLWCTTSWDGAAVHLWRLTAAEG